MAKMRGDESMDEDEEITPD